MVQRIKKKDRISELNEKKKLIASQNTIEVTSASNYTIQSISKNSTQLHCFLGFQQAN